MKITRKELTSLIEKILLKEATTDKDKPTHEEIKAALRQGGFGRDDYSGLMQVTIGKGSLKGKSGLMIMLRDGPEEKKLLDWCRANDKPRRKRDRDRITSIRGVYTQSIQDQAYEYLKRKFPGKVELVDIDNIAGERLSTLKGIEDALVHSSHVYRLDFIKKQNRNRTTAPFEKRTREFLQANAHKLPKELKRIAKDATSDIKAKNFVVVVPSGINSAGRSAGKGIAGFKK